MIQFFRWTLGEFWMEISKEFELKRVEKVLGEEKIVFFLVDCLFLQLPHKFLNKIQEMLTLIKLVYFLKFYFNFLKNLNCWSWMVGWHIEIIIYFIFIWSKNLLKIFLKFCQFKYFIFTTTPRALNTDFTWWTEHFAGTQKFSGKIFFFLKNLKFIC